MTNLFGTDVPANQDQSNGAPGITTATRIRFNSAGTITAVDWWCPLTVPSGGAQWLIVGYNPATDSPTGGLGSGTFSGLTGGGWNSASCSISVSAGDEIIVETWNGDGRYVNTGGYFATDVTRAGMTGPADVDPGGPHNGRFNVGGAPAFPTDGFNANGYFVAVQFTPSTPQLSLGGTVTPTGTLVKRVIRTLAGATTPTGAVTRQPGKRVAGSITPAAALVRSPQKTLGGVVAPTGAVAKRIGRALGGGISPTGGLLKLLSRALGGHITPTGSVATAGGGPSTPGRLSSSIATAALSAAARTAQAASAATSRLRASIRRTD